MYFFINLSSLLTVLTVLMTCLTIYLSVLSAIVFSPRARVMVVLQKLTEDRKLLQEEK